MSLSPSVEREWWWTSHLLVCVLYSMKTFDSLPILGFIVASSADLYIVSLSIPSRMELLKAGKNQPYAPVTITLLLTLKTNSMKT